MTTTTLNPGTRVRLVRDPRQTGVVAGTRTSAVTGLTLLYVSLDSGRTVAVPVQGASHVLEVLPA